MTGEETVERITAVEQAVKSAQHQIDEMKELINSIHELASEVRYMRTDVNKMQSDIDEIKSKPKKRYDLIVTGIITALTSGIIGFVISSIFN